MQEPLWVTDGQGCDAVAADVAFSTQTDIGRGADVAVSLRQLVDQTFFLRPRVDVLVVGAGHATPSGVAGVNILCPYQSYNIAVALEEQGIDYTMTIVDVTAAPLEDIARRRRVVVPASFLQDFPGEQGVNWRREAWQAYLAKTGQADAVTYEHIEGLVTDPLSGLQDVLRQGIHYARIPRGFEERLADGRIETVQSDVTALDLPKTYDLVVCSNVLYLLTALGQKRAVYNLTKAMKAHRSALHLLDPRRNALMAGVQAYCDDVGGWFDREKQQELRLLQARHHANDVLCSHLFVRY